MLKVKDKGIIIQIIKRCKRISDKLSNVSKEIFDNNDDIKEVICFNIFQIGELANGLSTEFINLYNDVPWKQIISMRNRIVHGYDTVDFEIVWNTAKDNISQLLKYCERIIENN